MWQIDSAIAQAAQPRKSRHISGTPGLTSSYEERNRRIQTIWPSNKLLSSQLENNFHAMKQELANLADREFNDTTRQYNLTRKEHHAINRFAKTSQLVFKKGDKTTCIVVKNRADYVREGMAHLSGTKTYKRLDRDLTPEVVEYLRYTLD